MYFQVLVETSEKIGKSKENKRIYELDKISKEEILKDIIIPYLQKTEFQFDGYFLKSENVLRIVVKVTETSARELSQYENDHMPAGVIMYVSPEDILEYDNYTQDITKEIFAEGRQIIDSGSTGAKVSTKNVDIDKTKVFVVHGHDELAKTEVARYIEKLGFEPIILHEQASSGKTIIEKIEAYSNVGYGVVLYTPCDVGSKNEPKLNLQLRARQNVVFEHGFLMGKIGRNNVCALVKDQVETPNDISGVVYISMDPHIGWHLALAKELRNSGYRVDMNVIV